MKRLLLIVTVICGCLVSLSAVDYQAYRPSQAQMQGYDANALNAQAPDYQFTGTSTMQTGSYTVPVSALNANSVAAEEETVTRVAVGPRRLGRPDYEEEEPEQYPIGDAPWMLMLGLALVYAALRARKMQKA